MSKFGFDKAKKPGSTAAANIARKIPPLPDRGDVEEMAVTHAETKGFVDRGGENVSASRRRRKVEPQGRLMITGPQRVLDRLRDYTDNNGYRAYWEVIDELLKDADGGRG